jgi:hypothetical protein
MLVLLRKHILFASTTYAALIFSFLAIFLAKDAGAIISMTLVGALSGFLTGVLWSVTEDFRSKLGASYTGSSDPKKRRLAILIMAVGTIEITAFAILIGGSEGIWIGLLIAVLGFGSLVVGTVLGGFAQKRSKR